MKKLLIILGLALICGCIQTGTGTTTDTVHSIEKSGFFCPTWKVWLTNDHPVAPNDNGQGGNEAIYSIDPQYRDQVLPIIQQAKDQNKKVTLEYRTDAFTFGCIDELNSGYAIIEKATLQP